MKPKASAVKSLKRDAKAGTAHYSKQFRSAFSQFLKNREAKKSSAPVEAKARHRMHTAIQYLEQDVIQIGDSRKQIRELMGDPYGEWGNDSWLYPGPERDHFYRIDFEQDRVSAKYFTRIYDAESGK